MNVDVKINPVYLPYLDKPQFNQIYFGGSSSGKSYFLAQKIVLDNINGVNWLCCRNVASTMSNSVFNEIMKAISNMNLSEYYKVNRSTMVITNLLNNKQILFSGLDNPEKVKSITPIDGVIERIFIEEATEIKYSAYKQLTKRLRGDSEHGKCVILAFNPILKSHWIYQQFFKEWVDGENKYENNHYGATDKTEGTSLTILKTTYKDNLFLTADDKELLENESDPYYYNVYSLGNWGILGNIIFKNWRVEDLSERARTFDHLLYGCDFGYSNDPNALIKVHYDKTRKKIYILDDYYQAGMNDDELVAVSKKFVGNNYITCDSAEAKTIDYLAMHGIKAVPAIKGADSINRGIRWLQTHEIIIDYRCQNFKNEIEQYHWQEDKYGNAMAKAVDANNHCLTGDTIVHTTEGNIPIKELVGKSGKVYCYDEENKKATVSDFYDCRLTQENAEIYEITLADGKTIKTTGEHPVLTNRGWICTKDLTCQDEIVKIY